MNFKLKLTAKETNYMCNLLPNQRVFLATESNIDDKSIQGTRLFSFYFGYDVQLRKLRHALVEKMACEQYFAPQNLEVPSEFRAV